MLFSSIIYMHRIIKRLLFYQLKGMERYYECPGYAIKSSFTFQSPYNWLKGKSSSCEKNFAQPNIFNYFLFCLSFVLLSLSTKYSDLALSFTRFTYKEWHLYFKNICIQTKQPVFVYKYIKSAWDNSKRRYIYSI